MDPQALAPFVELIRRAPLETLTQLASAELMEHFLHPDVLSFAKTGVIPPLHLGSAFLPVFTTLEKSSGVTREADVWSPFILATTDFCKTIKPESTERIMDRYLRPAQWTLSRSKKGNQDQVLILLSLFEANRFSGERVNMSTFVYMHPAHPNG